MSEDREPPAEPQRPTRAEVDAYIRRLVAEGHMRRGGPLTTRPDSLFQLHSPKILIQIAESSASELLVLAASHSLKHARGMRRWGRVRNDELLVGGYLRKRLVEAGVSRAAIPRGVLSDVKSHLLSVMQDNAQGLSALVKDNIDPLIENLAREYPASPEAIDLDNQEILDEVIHSKLVYYYVSEGIANHIENKLLSRGLNDLDAATTAKTIIEYFENPARYPAEPANEQQVDLLIDLLFSTNVTEFNRASKLSLPPEAPAVWSKHKDREEGETVIQFLRRVWGRYMDAGVLYQDDIKRLGDPGLVPALRAYCHRHQMDPRKVLPPPRQARLDRALAQVEPGSPAAVILEGKLRNRQATARRRQADPVRP